MPPWAVIARQELGVAEVWGPKSNPRIDAYIRAVGGRLEDSKFAWCSAFLCWCMIQVGLPHTKSGLARSWLRGSVTTALAAFRPGCIVVFKRAGVDDGIHGHVAIGVRIEGKKVLCLGGNQTNRVCERWYPISRVLGYRWPKGA